jgi:hypothetical protein
MFICWGKYEICFSGLLCHVVVTNPLEQCTFSIFNLDGGGLSLTSNVYFFGRTHLDLPFSQAAVHMIFIAMSTGI